MNWTRFAKVVRLVLVAMAICWAADHVVRAQSDGKVDQNGMPKMRNTTQAQRKAAAKNKKQAGLRRLGAPAKGAKGRTAGAASLAAAPLAATALAATPPAPGATPDYFGPYSNWANSPLPQGPVNPVVTITSAGSGYITAPLVTISDVYGTGTGATATATLDVNGQVASIAVLTPGSSYAAPVVAIDPPPCVSTGCEIATASATIAGAASYAGGLRKFVDTLPNLTVATPDIVTYPGTDYYEIELVEYTDWKFHADLPLATQLRGYHQTNNGTDTTGCLPAGCTVADNTVAPPPVSYLGPAIIAQKGRPTRIKFTNNLPNMGAGGELFIPVDTTVMGAGSGFDPVSGRVGTYPQNRGTLHLHGGFTPWVSDGTPHQWVTPTGEGGPLTTGVSTQPVPDMELGSGNSMTFYWTNQQSGRLMFYHDHAYGITRLNVYAGEAAGYLLVDPVERKLTDGTTAGIPVMADVPLVIQDKTFVWGDQAAGTGTWATDPTWNWGSAAGSLWFPHVYMPNQNPWDISGANAMGRWDYALWFWPPYTGIITHPDVPNPYTAPWEPPMIPGTPNPSLVPEAFMDTPLVNGKAYPTTTVEPKPYRLRILNACNDRFVNLSFFAADPLAATATGVSGTEVKMVPFNSSQNLVTPFPSWWYTAGLNFTFDDRAGGVPDPTTRGPAMIQIGTEGGLLPAPALIRNQPVNYTYNRRDIVVLSVQEKALFLGPAERADVIVDFSKFAGKTLILYNDAPAPVPAADQRIDYFTGGEDQTDTGGAPPTLPGYGPNTRTVMQIVVGPGGDSSAPRDYYDPALMTALNVALPPAFAASQDPIVVPQVAYNAAYPASPTLADVPGNNVSRISDTSLTFTPLNAAATLTTPLQPKAIQELFELDYGRMNATLGVELRFTNGANQTTLPFGYIDPATELIDTSATPATPPTAGDGTQIWKITHNGVDTHAIHVHLFNVQVLNRVGWDGAIRRPDPNELGWKETVRMNPLEDIIVALRPTTPQLPFGLPDSVRLMDVTMPPGSSGQFAPFGPDGNPANTTNQLFNFGWEYVWHCHLLGHEENDMMRPTVFNTFRALPAAPVPLALSEPGSGTIALNWTDTTPFNYATDFTTVPPSATLGNPANEIGFRIERAAGNPPGAFSPVGNAPANATSYNDTTIPNPGTPQTYSYHVIAYNAAGDSSPAASSILYVVPPTVTFTGAPATAAYNTSFTVTAATNASVMPTIAGVGVCSVGPVGGSPTGATALVTMTGSTGDCALTASWPANAGYQAATATQSTTATKVTPTVTFTGAPASAPYGATFTVVTTTNSTATAVITSGGACSNAGTLVTMTSGTGTCLLTATWAADANYQGATATQSTTALQVAPTVTFTGAPASAANGATFTVTATTNASTVPTITGTGACLFGPASGSTATITMTSGTGVCSLTAIWAGDANYLSATASQSTTALSASSLLLSPTSLLFGDQLVGTASIAQTVTLTNTGSTTVTISSVTFTGNFARSGGTCAGSLLAGQTCTIGVRFSPLASGPAVGQLSIVASDQASPHTAALSGNGIAPVASMSPATLVFNTPLSVPSAPQTVTVTNTGTAPLTINNVTRTGPNRGQFAHLTTCPGSLPVGASCTITVTFSPTTANPSTKTATLNLVVAAPATNKTVALTGNIVAPTFTMSPAALAFGGQARLTVSAPRVVTVSNTGTAPLRINNVTRTGANPGQFAQTNTCGPFPATLAVGGSCTISVTFRPTTLGAKTASLRVAVAAPATSQSIPLSGTGQ